MYYLLDKDRNPYEITHLLWDTEFRDGLWLKKTNVIVNKTRFKKYNVYIVTFFDGLDQDNKYPLLFKTSIFNTNSILDNFHQYSESWNNAFLCHAKTTKDVFRILDIAKNTNNLFLRSNCGIPTAI